MMNSRVFGLRQNSFLAGAPRNHSRLYDDELRTSTVKSDVTEWQRGWTQNVVLAFQRLSPQIKSSTWRGYDAVIQVYNATGDVIETHEHAGD